VEAILLADAEHRHDVGVMQLCRRPRLAMETPQVPRIEQGMRGQHLDGHMPAQRQLLRLVDDAHPTSAHLTQDLVVPHLLHRHRGGRGCGLTPLTRSVVGGLGLLHQHEGGQHLADLVGMLGVAPCELLDGGLFALPERLDELIGDLPQRVGSRRIVVAHTKISSMPPGTPWNTSSWGRSTRTARAR